MREIYLGSWQGEFVVELERNNTYQCYLQTPEQYFAEEQESFLAVAQRMSDVIDAVKQMHYEQIAIVSHGVAIASYIAYINDGDFKNVWRYLLKNGDFVEYEI